MAKHRLASFWQTASCIRTLVSCHENKVVREEERPGGSGWNSFSICHGPSLPEGRETTGLARAPTLKEANTEAECVLPHLKRRWPGRPARLGAGGTDSWRKRHNTGGAHRQPVRSALVNGGTDSVQLLCKQPQPLRRHCHCTARSAPISQLSRFRQPPPDPRRTEARQQLRQLRQNTLFPF